MSKHIDAWQGIRRDMEKIDELFARILHTHPTTPEEHQRFEKRIRDVIRYFMELELPERMKAAEDIDTVAEDF